MNRSYCCLVALLTLPVAAEMTYIEWMESGQPALETRAPVQWPQVDPGHLTIYDSLADFLAATASMELTFEDFEGGFSQPGNIRGCYTPANHQSDGPCFGHGQLQEGFALRVGRGVVLSNQLVLLSPGTIDPERTLIGANTLDPPLNPTRIEFDRGQAAVAMDVYDGARGDAVVVHVYGQGDTLLGSFIVDPPSANAPVFAGFTSTVPIAAVEINAVFDFGGELFTHLYFGGVPARLSVVSGNADFGAVNLGQTATAAIDFANTGDLELVLGTVPEPVVPFAIVTDGCSETTLPPGGHCRVEFSVVPDAIDGYRATVAIPSNDPNGPLFLQLEAEATAPRLSMIPGGIRFGAVAPGASGGPEVLELVNLHAGTVTVTAIDEASAPFERVAGSCGPAPFSLAPGEGCTLEYVFSPGEEGRYTEELIVVSNAGMTPITLAGEGTIPGRGHQQGGMQ